MPIDIGKAKESFDKDRKPMCFNCEIYGHMAKDFWKLKKEIDTWKCYECEQIGHIARDCRTKQKMKKQIVQEDKNTDIKEEDKQKGFGEDPK